MRQSVPKCVLFCSNVLATPTHYYLCKHMNDFKAYLPMKEHHKEQRQRSWCVGLSCAYGFLWRSERKKEIAKRERAQTKGNEE